MGCCSRLFILIASLNSQFDVVSSSGRAVVLWRFGLISNVSWETCCADGWGDLQGQGARRLDKSITTEIYIFMSVIENDTKRYIQVRRPRSLTLPSAYGRMLNP